VAPKEAEEGWIHLQDTQGKPLFQFFKYRHKKWVYLNCTGPKEKQGLVRQNCEAVYGRLLLK
jgi:hypothetical protein